MISGIFILGIDGNWEFVDLGVFPKIYSEVYSVLYLLEDLPSSEESQVDYTFQVHPWEGGYSALNFYSHLYKNIPKKNRLKLVAMENHSPGFFELAAILAVAKTLSVVVKQVCGSIGEINKTYGEIHAGIQERKLNQLKIKKEQILLAERDIRFLEQSAKKLSDQMGYPFKEQLDIKTKDPFTTLKILLSVYRRVWALAKLQSEAKLDLSSRVKKGKG